MATVLLCAANIVVVLASSSAAHAASGVTAAWRAAASPDPDIGSGIASDSAGNLYVTGCTRSAGTFGSGGSAVTLPSYGDTDGFVASFDASGTLRWVVRLGSTTLDCGNDLALGPAGELYVVGDVSFPATFGEGAATLNNTGSGAGFVARYDTDGTFRWVEHAATTAATVSADANGPVIGGRLSTSETFGTGPGATTLTNAGAADGYVAALDPSGAGRWAHQLGVSTGFLSITDVFDVAHDPSGNVVVAGSFDTTTDLGAGTVFSAGSQDAFLLKYTAAGARLWSRTAGGTLADRALGVAPDAAGNLYLTGQHQFGAVFGSGAGAVTLPGTGSTDGFLAKYGPNGGFAWAKSVGGPDPDLAVDVAVDGAGNPTITGTFSLYAIADPMGAQARLFSRGSSDIFTAQFSSGGVLRWARQAGGASGDGVTIPPYPRTGGITRTSTGGVAVVASLGQGAHVGDTVGGIDLAGMGSTDVVVASYGAMSPGTAPVTGNLSLNAVDGQALSFTVPATDADGDTLAVSLDAPGPAHGIARAGGLQVTYRSSGFVGTDTVPFSVHDGRGLRASGVATITVAPAAPTSTPAPWAIPLRHLSSGSPTTWSAVDGAGDVAVATNFGGSLTVGEEPRQAPVTEPATLLGFLVTRFGPDGRLQWVRDGRSLVANAVASSHDGRTIVAAAAWSGAQLGPTTSPTIPAGALLVSYAPDGSVQWQLDVAGNGTMVSASVDGAGITHALGQTPTAITLAGTSIPAGSYVVTVGVDGTATAATSLPSPAAGSEIATAPDGRMYVTGSFKGSVTFGSGAGAVTLTAPDSVSDYPFLAAYDASGAFAWARMSNARGETHVGAGAASVAWVHGLALDALASAGAPMWSVTYTAGGTQSALRSVAVDRQGSVWTAGYYAVSFSGPSVSLTASAWEEVVVLHHSASGALLWAHHDGSSQRERADAIRVADDGSATVSGWYEGSTFDVTDGGGSWTLPKPNQEDGFVAHYGRQPAAVGGTVRTGATPEAGATVSLFDGSLTKVAETTTAADGTYAFAGLPAGSYRVLARSGTRQRWHTSATTWWYAEVVVVATGQTQTGVDVTLP